MIDWRISRCTLLGVNKIACACAYISLYYLLNKYSLFIYNYNISCVRDNKSTKGHI